MPPAKTSRKVRRRNGSPRSRNAYLLRTYGITEEQYWEIYRAQNGKCYICQRATGATRLLSVDHDHKTGYVRGLLCGPDNRALGRIIRDDVDTAQRIIDYLINPPAFGVIGKVVVPSQSVAVLELEYESDPG